MYFCKSLLVQILNQTVQYKYLTFNTLCQWATRYSRQNLVEMGFLLGFVDEKSAEKTNSRSFQTSAIYIPTICPWIIYFKALTPTPFPHL